MSYIEGFTIPVPHSNKDACVQMAREAAPFFRDCGATRIVECWGDDVKQGEHTDFFMAVKAEEGENVMFSWIEYPDRETRDAAYEKMEKHEGFSNMSEMPFDGKRMVFSGFMAVFDSAGTLA